MIQSLLNHRGTDAIFACPCGDRLRPSERRHHATTNSRPAISGLLLPCRPSAVIGGVRAIVVDAFQCMDRRWLRPHVAKEGVKAVAPTITHRDTTPTVPSIGFIARVRRPAARGRPNLVFLRVRASVRGALQRQAGARAWAALRDGAAQQAKRLCRALLAAVAATAPQPITVFGMPSAVHRNQATEATSRQIKRHGNKYTGFKSIRVEASE